MKDFKRLYETSFDYKLEAMDKYKDFIPKKSYLELSRIISLFRLQLEPLVERKNLYYLNDYHDADIDALEELPDWFKENPVVLVDLDLMYKLEQKEEVEKLALENKRGKIEEINRKSKNSFLLNLILYL